MAVCSACGQEMTISVGCSLGTYDDFTDGIARERVPYGSEERERTGDVCHDCGAPRGALHHPGCDVEQCPRCDWQVISCECEVRE